MRRGGRTDKPHAEIRTALRQAGCAVHDCSGYGDGFPDLCVWVPGPKQLLLMEVKSPGGKLEPKQVEFLQRFPATVIVESIEQALRTVFQIRKSDG